VNAYGQEVRLDDGLTAPYEIYWFSRDHPYLHYGWAFRSEGCFGEDEPARETEVVVDKDNRRIECSMAGFLSPAD
jgi:hypothetical protein